MERCQQVGFLNPIVPLHCVGVFVRGERALRDIFPKREATRVFSKLGAAVWSTPNNELTAQMRSIWTMWNCYAIG